MVRGPLGEPVEAGWGVLGDGRTAVIEMAAASGLPLVPADRRDPRPGQHLRHRAAHAAALDEGLRRLVIGIGGSATNDGGAGLARALGVRFLDAAGRELPEGGAALARLARVDLGGLDPRLAEADLLVACDVDNPLTGPRGASAVYGPQKGATPEVVARARRTPWPPTPGWPGPPPGATWPAGPGPGRRAGWGPGCSSSRRPGSAPAWRWCWRPPASTGGWPGRRLVITGEGRTDAQTAMGKAPMGVAAAAARHGVPVVCLSGGLGEGADEVLAHGIDALAAVVPRPMTLEEAMRSGEALIEAATARACRLLRVGQTLGR